jgi:hypothetical protein
VFYGKLAISFTYAYLNFISDPDQWSCSQKARFCKQIKILFRRLCQKLPWLVTMDSERNFQPDRNLGLMDQVRHVPRCRYIDSALNRPVANKFLVIFVNMAVKSIPKKWEESKSSFNKRKIIGS